MSKLSSIDVVILCGGLGTRLRRTIGATQKTMAHINGEPFLNVHLRYLAGQGFKRVVLCTGYRAAAVKKYYQGHDLGLDIAFSPELEPLGTGGALRQARRLIHSDPFVVLNGDSFCPVAFKRLFAFYRRQKSAVTVALARAGQARDYGTVAVDRRGHISAFREKGFAGPTLVNAGVYCFSARAFKLMPRRKKFSLEKDFFPALPQSQISGFKTSRDFIDIGTPVRFKRAARVLAKMK